MKLDTPPPASGLKKDVLSRIECENICPRGRWFYRGKEFLVWTTWIITVLVAAVAVAISFFVIMHRQYAIFEATHDSFLALMLDVLPYLWLLVFAAAAILALYHFRNTKRGYRYSFLTIAGATVLSSFVGGLFFHYLGMSFVFDDALGKYLPGMYVSQAMQEKRFWQNPHDGRLLATLREETASGTTAIVVDAEGTQWEVNISELFPKDVALLREGKQVRILGSQPSGEDSSFHACGVFPWLYSKMMTMADFKHDREDAILRLHEHRDRMLERARETYQAAKEGVRSASGSDETMTLATSAIPESVDQSQTESQCGDIAAVKRLRD
ncbi:hypothetical protein K2Q16_02900 [Patescibacteria group bacterium]|nr:hypothetical protein [Patescibacteria group bacterium]